ncbi:AbgT family transporter, partial [uncultured Cetobacterium sp.]|uniref:AbgT family transporter n=1 Tax=uncultured Cetobacterium sp. TaxID=527638 RepID=UPI00262BED4C
MEAELKKNELKNKSFIDKFLNIIEKGGNALPHPATLFAILAIVVIVISGIGGALGWSVDFVGINSKTMKTEEMIISTK